MNQSTHFHLYQNRSRLSAGSFAGIFLLAMLMICAISPVKAAASDEQKVFNFLTGDMGLNPAGACGIMSNIYEESNFVANITGSGGAYGICQWMGQRKTNLISWCKSNKYTYSTLDGQLHFLQYELKNQYPSVLSYIQSVPNTAEGAYKAGYHWCYYFEIPGDRANASVYRGNKAKNTWWPKYGSGALYLSVSGSGKNAVLTWNGSGAGGFSVRRSTSKNGTYTALKKTGSSVKTWTDTTTVPGKTYYYKVVALTSKGKDSIESNKVSYACTASLSDSVCKATLARTSFTFNNKNRKPKVTVVYNGTTLKKGTDFKIAYSNNKNVGTAVATIIGKGSYTGSIKLKFKITKATQTIKASDKTVTYKDADLSLTIKAKTKIKLKPANTKVIAVKNGKLHIMGSGTCRIRVRAVASQNYEAAEKYITVTVKPAKGSISSISTPGSGRARVYFSNKSSPAGYEIWASTSKDFKTNVIRKTAGSSATSVLFTGLQQNKVWYFKVIGYTMKNGSRVNGKWSKIVKVKVK